MASQPKSPNKRIRVATPRPSHITSPHDNSLVTIPVDIISNISEFIEFSDYYRLLHVSKDIYKALRSQPLVSHIPFALRLYDNESVAKYRNVKSVGIDMKHWNNLSITAHPFGDLKELLLHEQSGDIDRFVQKTNIIYTDIETLILFDCKQTATIMRALPVLNKLCSLHLENVNLESFESIPPGIMKGLQCLRLVDVLISDTKDATELFPMLSTLSVCYMGEMQRENATDLLQGCINIRGLDVWNVNSLEMYNDDWEFDELFGVFMTHLKVLSMSGLNATEMTALLNCAGEALEHIQIIDSFNQYKHDRTTRKLSSLYYGGNGVSVDRLFKSLIHDWGVSLDVLFIDCWTKKSDNIAKICKRFCHVCESWKGKNFEAVIHFSCFAIHDIDLKMQIGDILTSQKRTGWNIFVGSRDIMIICNRFCGITRPQIQYNYQNQVSITNMNLCNQFGLMSDNQISQPDVEHINIYNFKRCKEYHQDTARTPLRYEGEMKGPFPVMQFKGEWCFLCKEHRINKKWSSHWCDKHEMAQS
eukprot:1013639_1